MNNSGYNTDMETEETKQSWRGERQRNRTTKKIRKEYGRDCNCGYCQRGRTTCARKKHAESKQDMIDNTFFE